MAKPKAVRAQPLVPAPPEAAYDPFALANQFDQMRVTSQPSFSAPVVQPKPITYGGAGPVPASVPKAPQAAASPTSAGHYPGDGHNHGVTPLAPGTASQQADWGQKTVTFQQQFPSLRHTSGYRSPERNAATPGASPTSYHMQKDAQGNARANDYVGSPRDMAAAGAWAKANGAKEVLIHNAGTGQHLHIAWS